MAEGFLGAVVGVVLTIVAQWYLGPRIERRMRAVERWEGFVIEFALLIDRPIRQAQIAARSAWTRWHGMYELEAERPDLDQERHEAIHEQDQRAFRDALGAWGDSLARAEWLERQIVGDYSLATRRVP
jgi:hypothetical protein